jgi:hypothetical protein
MAAASASVHTTTGQPGSLPILPHRTSPGRGRPASGMWRNAGSTDADGTDGTDADGTDGTDADGTDGTDADGTDDTDADGTADELAGLATGAALALACTARGCSAYSDAKVANRDVRIWHW